MALAGVALITAVVQVVFAVRRRELLPFLPEALGATAVALLCGIYLMLAAEFHWHDGEFLDNVSPWIAIASLWWSFYHRMGSKRNRRPAADA